jgi:hypothetical protein
MSDTRILQRLRSFLMLLAAAMFAGIIGELVLSEHTDEPMQLVPFVLCGLGLLALLLAHSAPGRRSILALRIAMLAVMLAGPVGIYEHFQGNLAFDRETHPNAGTARLLRAALTGGDPLLAPGALIAAAAIALVATYGAVSPDARDTVDETSAAPAGARR